MGGGETLLVGASADKEMSGGGQVAGIGVVLDVIRVNDISLESNDDGAIEYVNAGMVRLTVGFDDGGVRCRGGEDGLGYRGEELVGIIRETG